MADKLFKSLSFGGADRYLPAPDWGNVQGKPAIPSKTSDLTNDSGYITASEVPNTYTHPDTHPATMITQDATHRFATDAEKLNWNAAEANVQADWNVTSTTDDAYIKNKPTKLSDFTNDLPAPEIPDMAWSNITGKPATYPPDAHNHDDKYQPKGNYLTSYTETDPTVPAWAKTPNKPTYTASEVGAAPIVHEHSDLMPKSGGTFTGMVSAPDPMSNAHVATKKYVDDSIGGIDIPAGDWASLTGKPSTFPPSAHGHAWSEITGKPDIPTDIPKITYGTTDLTAGVSPLAEGTFYFVYE